MHKKKLVWIVLIVIIFFAATGFLLVRTLSTSKPQLLISAGGAEGYPMYTISVPNDWLVDHDGNEGIDRLTISNNGYAIRIGQEPGGGIQCLYDKNGPEVVFPLRNYPSFIEIATKNNAILRRGLGSQDNFEFCENIGGEWSAPTSVGELIYVVPENPDDAVLKEMDAIVSSLDKEKSYVVLTDQFVAEINKELLSFNTSYAKFFINGTPIETDTAYDKTGMIIKLSAIFLKDDIAIKREFYFDKGKSRFVHEVVDSYDEENWFYFENDKMVAWLTGPNKQEKAKDDAYIEQEQDVLRSELELLAGVAGD